MNMKRNDWSGSSALGMRRAKRSAFTLIEVMVAGGILFLALFAILALFSNSLRGVRALQHKRVDAGMLAAEYSLTNQIVEGRESGDFGELYRDYRWEREVFPSETNGLFQVDFFVYRRGGSGTPESQLSILLFDPASANRPGFSPRPR
jgi:hypothetical protein